MSGLPTGPGGRALALLFLVLAMVLVWFGVIGPLSDLYTDRAETVQREEMLARRMESLIAATPALERLAQAQSAGTTPIPPLEGASDGVAAAALQQKLNEFANASDLHIASAETLPAEAAGDWRAIGVRVTLSGAWPDLTRLLRAIERSETPMVVSELQLHGPPQNIAAAAAPDRAWPIEASLIVTALRETRP